MNWYQEEEKLVFSKLNTDKEKGLTLDVVEERQRECGFNELPEQETKSFWEKLIAQFQDILILILIGASIISFFVGEGVDAIIIIAIVIINAFLGIYQEGKAEEAVAALRKMASPEAKVIRNGSFIRIPSRELVPGDLVDLETGDIVPADLRLVESVNLKIDEASFTGESVPAEKDASRIFSAEVPLGDRENMAFSSTVVAYGHGQGIVTDIGQNTEIGKIAQTIQAYEEEDTPLQKKLSKLGKSIGFIVLGICAFVLAVGLLRGKKPLDMFMTSVALAVAAVPEGLPAIVTIVLSLGMGHMAKRHAIVKKLLAVETLGTTTYICSDKTGTLTQNQMTVVKVYVDGEEADITGRGYEPKGNILIKDKIVDSEKLSSLYTLMSCAALSNDSKLVYDDGMYSIFGDPTEGALITFAGKKGLTKKELNESYPRIAEIPFDSTRKMMTTFHEKFLKDRIVSFTKGAPDIILKRCKYYLINGQKLEMTTEVYQKVMDVNSKYAQSALRVLGFAFKDYDCMPQKPTSDADEQNMIFLGLVGMIDPPREEVKEAIRLCKHAGITPVMITGDYLETAIAIGQDLGMVRESNEALMGHELDSYSDVEMQELVKQKRVFARVSSEHKVRIVDALKANGEIVAMTGDGVNDAPAIKKADIGISMGITGTDVAKNTADVILTDDNFASIVSAVEEGRIIYSNIKKFVKFLLSCNIGEILIVLIAIMANLEVPFLPIQLLWLNLVTDSFPALALGVEPGAEDIMEEPPRDANESILDKHTAIAIILQAIAIAATALASYLYGLRHYDSNLSGARTVALVTLILAELFRSYSIRSEHFTLAEIGPFTNKSLNFGVGLSFLLTMVIIYVPFLNVYFKTVPLGIKEWLIIAPLSFVPLMVGEIYKKIRYRKQK